MLRAIVRIHQDKPAFELSLILKGKNRVMLRMKDEVLEKTLIRIAKNLEDKKSRSRDSDRDILIAIYKVTRPVINWHLVYSISVPTSKLYDAHVGS